ncbi:L,D-transpeptidase [Bifidobacterium sp. 82T24]|uniref:L,D-transpeptidase n=1 Tax=Bifidobacterium pluvialisilvae TaxID=2834436 RepID=UPI001C58FDB5|nr:L,D-transpeptidase [Bifidobacterium pluvialisilvae]MBW3087867.1 L,D-transpeptidase [Bifidobacterium pluvialisilvae]
MADPPWIGAFTADTPTNWRVHGAQGLFEVMRMMSGFDRFRAGHAKETTGEARSRSRGSVLGLVISFLRLFDRTTRILIVACLVVTMASLGVLIPRGSAPLMADSSDAPLAVEAADIRETPAASTKRARAVPAPDKTPKTPSWQLPTGGTHIDLGKVRNLHLVVSLSRQRVYVMSGNHVVYTMICSTGMRGSTPKGDYRIQNRGGDFFNERENMGAKYWVSWANYGEYLFHTVPTDRKGRYIASEAEKLGRPASHGCVRLSVADAQWLYRQLPEGTPVSIR